MRDFISKNQGNSRLLKSSIPAGTTWEQALALFRAGTFPIDFAGLNPDGILQQGTALNKANLLSDATEERIWGDADDRTVDSALWRLGEAHLYHWARRQVATEDYHEGRTYISSLRLTQGYSVSWPDEPTEHIEVSNIIYYASQLDIDQSTGTVSIEPEGSITVWDYRTSSVTDCQILKGKWFYAQYSCENTAGVEASKVYYVPQNAVFSRNRSGSDNNEIYYLMVNTSFESYATKAGGAFDIDVVYSSDRDAYPDSGIHDGYLYQFLGVPAENAIWSNYRAEPILETDVTEPVHKIDIDMSNIDWARYSYVYVDFDLSVSSSNIKVGVNDITTGNTLNWITTSSSNQGYLWSISTSTLKRMCFRVFNNPQATISSENIANSTPSWGTSSSLTYDDIIALNIYHGQSSGTMQPGYIRVWGVI